MLRNLVFIIIGVFTLPCAFAKPGGDSELRVKQPLKSPHSFELSMGMTSHISADTLFFSSRGASEQLSDFKLNYKFQKTDKNSKKYIDFKTSINVEEEFVYPNAKEFYFSNKVGAGTVTLGRKKQNWFKLEEVWDLGLWQPRFAADRLHPETQGLLAAFYSHKVGNWQLTGFYSPLFIPEIPPGFKISDGAITSENPWFRAPWSTIDFEEIPGETPVHFELGKFDVWNDILSKQTVGASAEYQAGPYRLSTSYAYKPMNQILMQFPFELNIGGGADQVNIYMNPVVVHHHLVGVEGAYRKKNWSARALVNFESPEANKAPDDWVSQGVEDATVTSLYYDYKVSKSTSIYTSYLKVWGGDIQDHGPQLILQGKKFFERRYNYTNAVKVGVNQRLSNFFSKRATLKSEALYDSDQNAAVLSSSLGVRVSGNTKIKFGFDLLGLINDEPSTVDDGFIRNFRANDRVFGELSYAF